MGAAAEENKSLPLKLSSYGERLCRIQASTSASLWADQFYSCARHSGALGDCPLARGEVGWPLQQRLWPKESEGRKGQLTLSRWVGVATRACLCCVPGGTQETLDGPGQAGGTWRPRGLGEPGVCRPAAGLRSSEGVWRHGCRSGGPSCGVGSAPRPCALHCPVLDAQSPLHGWASCSEPA